MPLRAHAVLLTLTAISTHEPTITFVESVSVHQINGKNSSHHFGKAGNLPLLGFSKPDKLIIFGIQQAPA